MTDNEMRSRWIFLSLSAYLSLSISSLAWLVSC
uniref:Uncharacterized protein n=1 Tax=Arundo donax TaxID=35708 RepID=A0A0A9DUR8_ARUDO